MATITWSGSFNGTSAGSGGQTTTLTASGILPADAVIKSITYSIKVGASAGYEPSYAYNCYWFHALSGTTTGAHIGSIGGTTVVGTVPVEGNRGTITGNLTLDNASIFRNTSITANVKANTTKNVSSYMYDASVTVTYYTMWWSSGASLSASQSGSTVTFTMTGNATLDPADATISYRLIADATGADEGTFSNNQCTITGWSPGTYSFYVRAQATTSTGTVYKAGPDCSVTINGPIFQWSSGASLSFTESGGNLTLTLNGSASCTNGYSGTIYYRFYEYYSSSFHQRNSDGSTSKTWTGAPVSAKDTWTTYQVRGYLQVGSTKYETPEDNAPQVSAMVHNPAIGWQTGTTATFSESAGKATIVLNKAAQIVYGYSGTIYYRVKNGSTTLKEGVSSTTISNITPPGLNSSYTYTIEAYTTIGGTTYTTTATQSTTGTVHSPTVTWPSGASITVSQSVLSAVVTRSSAATLNYGYSGTVYYRVFCATTQKNGSNDTSSTWTFTPTAYDTQLTFSVDAYVVISGTTYRSSALTKNATITTPKITWADGAYIEVVQDGMDAKIMRHGNAVVGSGISATPYYRVWMAGTRKNADGDTNSSGYWKYTPSTYDTPILFEVDAYITYGGSTFSTSKLSATQTIDSGNFLAYYNGSSWVQCRAYYYDGSNWIECKPYYYNGSSWVEISYS